MTETKHLIDARLFDALCDLMIYHYVDLRRPKKHPRKFSHSVALLKRHGIIKHRDDTGTLREQYDKLLEGYVTEILPAAYRPDHDHWGAKCIRLYGQSGKTSSFYTGDVCGFYMFFDNFAALEEYTIATDETIYKEVT